MGKRDLIGLIEAAYRVELDEDAWLKGVLEAASFLDRGLGLSAYTYEAPDGITPLLGRVQLAGAFDPSWLAAFAKARPPEMTPEGEEPAAWRSWLHLPVGTVSTTPGLEDVSAALPTLGGAHDVFVMNGFDPTLRGVIIGAPLQRKARIPEQPGKLYRRVASHLGSAYRLRRRIELGEANLEHADAVLSPDGKLLHAEGKAKGAEARAALREATRDLERTRSSGVRGDEERATKRWRGQVDARWTLTDRVERDQKRLVIATRNEVYPEALGALTQRERQVLAFAAHGVGDHDIAYALGLTASTIRVLIYRVGRKLGCRSRLDIIARFRALRGPAER